MSWTVTAWDPDTRRGVVKGALELTFEAPHAELEVGEAVGVSLVSAEPGRPHVSAIWPLVARLPDGSTALDGAAPVSGLPAPFRSVPAIEDGGELVFVGLDPYPDAYSRFGSRLCSQGELRVRGWRARLGELPVAGFVAVEANDDEVAFRCAGAPGVMRGGAVGSYDAVRYVPPLPSREWDEIEAQLGGALEMYDYVALSFEHRDGDATVRTVREGGEPGAVWRGPADDERAAQIAEVVRAWRSWMDPQRPE